MLSRNFAYDNVTCHPEYGRVTPQIQRESAQTARSGLVLDNTFTAKSFHTLRVYAENGLLQKKSVVGPRTRAGARLFPGVPAP